jgi:hypothetical protein
VLAQALLVPIAELLMGAAQGGEQATGKREALLLEEAANGRRQGLTHLGAAGPCGLHEDVEVDAQAGARREETCPRTLLAGLAGDDGKLTDPDLGRHVRKDYSTAR